MKEIKPDNNTLSNFRRDNPNAKKFEKRIEYIDSKL